MLVPCCNHIFFYFFLEVKIYAYENMKTRVARLADRGIVNLFDVNHINALANN
jgi:hypothetical protein